uniref:Uncharacterized protein n=1 Tax=Arundo donax TaxID=35708 RepID=A0A0A9F7Y4_ARUDO
MASFKTCTGLFPCSRRAQTLTQSRLGVFKAIRSFIVS